MKVFKYWTRESCSHVAEDGHNLWLTKLAGSNESLASAKAARTFIPQSPGPH